MVHELKIAPEYYQDVIYGRKTFEVRYNDRNYRVGDVLLLQEYKDNNYTGRMVERSISHILDDSKFLQEGYVAMSLCRKE